MAERDQSPDTAFCGSTSAKTSDCARRLLSETFHAHPLAIDDCFNGRVDTPKVDDYGDYLFIVAQSIKYHRPSTSLT